MLSTFLPVSPSLTDLFNMKNPCRGSWLISKVFDDSLTQLYLFVGASSSNHSKHLKLKYDNLKILEKSKGAT